MRGKEREIRKDGEYEKERKGEEKKERKVVIWNAIMNISNSNTVGIIQ